MEQIFQSATKVCGRILRTTPGLSGIDPDNVADVAEEAALMFVDEVMQNRVEDKTTTITFRLRNHCTKVCYRTAPGSIVDADADNAASELQQPSLVDYQVRLHEWLTGLGTLDTRQKAIVLYCALYPQDRNRVKRLCATLFERLALTLLAQEGTRLMPIPTEKTAPQPTPTTRMLFLEELYHQDPLLLVLILVIKDQEQLIQLFSLLGGQTISLPTLPELQKIWRVMEDATAAKPSEEKALLTLLGARATTDLTEVTPPPSTVSDTLRAAFVETAQRHARVEQKLLDSLGPDATTEQITTAYQTLSKNLTPMLAYVEHRAAPRQKKNTRKKS